MILTINKIAGITVIIIFSIIFVTSFIIYPEVGEKILYGKHPPGKEKSETLTYTEAINSKNYRCMESASLKANGDLSKFLEKFSNCDK